MPRDENFAFRCPDDLKQQALAYAEQEDLSIAQVIRRALREFLERTSGEEKKNG